ncbi:MAG TPA: two-component regulator propeller domain-containing protein [bacterium]|nr:two-component regulator propeller domain-containing protein [bacterium]
MYDGAEWQVLLGRNDVSPVCGAIGPAPGGAFTGTQYGVFEWSLSGDFDWFYAPGNTGLPLKMPYEIYKDSRDIYWICGPHTLLGFWEGFVFSLYERADISSAVYCADEDEAGNLWFGTSGDGVVVVSADGATITHIPFEVDDKWIDNIMCAPDGMTYVETLTAIYAINR